MIIDDRTRSTDVVTAQQKPPDVYSLASRGKSLSSDSLCQQLRYAVASIAWRTFSLCSRCQPDCDCQKLDIHRWSASVTDASNLSMKSLALLRESPPWSNALSSSGCPINRINRSSLCRPVPPRAGLNMYVIGSISDCSSVKDPSPSRHAGIVKPRRALFVLNQRGGGTHAADCSRDVTPPYDRATGKSSQREM